MKSCRQSFLWGRHLCVPLIGGAVLSEQWSLVGPPTAKLFRGTVQTEIESKTQHEKEDKKLGHLAQNRETTACVWI